MSKKQPKLTPWFPGDVDPVHEGIYKVTRRSPGISQHYPKKTWLYWNGRSWEHTDHSSLGSFIRSHAEISEKCTWRGLAVKP